MCRRYTPFTCGQWLCVIQSFVTPYLCLHYMGHCINSRKSQAKNWWQLISHCNQSKFFAWSLNRGISQYSVHNTEMLLRNAFFYDSISLYGQWNGTATTTAANKEKRNWKKLNDLPFRCDKEVEIWQWRQCIVPNSIWQT